MEDAALKEARLLIVDDEEANIRLLERVLKHWGYGNVRSTRDAREVLALYDEFQPDLILLDLHMPHLDGHQVLTQLAGKVSDGCSVPVLMLTADVTPAARNTALVMGAKDFLTKPIDPAEVMLRVRNLLETRMLHVRMSSQRAELEREVAERTRALESASADVLERFARVVELRDDPTGAHAVRVGRIAGALASALGVSPADVERIRRAAPLHDVGKVSVP